MYKYYERCTTTKENYNTKNAMRENAYLWNKLNNEEREQYYMKAEENAGHDPVEVVEIPDVRPVTDIR